MGMRARQKAVEDLQIDRNVPVHVLNELVKQTPEGVYFTVVRQDGQTLNVTGVAQTNERVSEFLRNTANNSQWLVKPELVEVKVSNAQTASRSGAARILRAAWAASLRVCFALPRSPRPHLARRSSRIL